MDGTSLNFAGNEMLGGGEELGETTLRGHTYRFERTEIPPSEGRREL